MKKKLLLAALALCSLQSYGQKNETGVIYGNTIITGKPTDVLQYGSFSSGFYYKRNFNITDKIQVSPGIIYNSSRLSMNGYFDNNNFKQMRYRYNKSGMIMTGVKVPVTASYTFMKGEKGGRAKVSSGIYGEYITSGVQQYMGDYYEVIKENAPIQNPIQAGINEEVSFAFALGQESKQYVVASAGAFYQLTEYLNTGSSFRPLQFYLKLGIAF